MAAHVRNPTGETALSLVVTLLTVLVLGPLLAAGGDRPAGSTARAGSLPIAAAGAQDTAGPVAQPGGDLPGDPAVRLVKVAGSLADPISVAAPNDGSGRLFVVERVGYVRVIDRAGDLLEEPFLDLDQEVKIDFLEQGLLGLAFHPAYAENGLFYVSYSDFTTNGETFVVEYTVSATDPDRADRTSARLVLAITADPYVSHNAGTIRFGPDGYLYFAVGDGGLIGDPYRNAQNVGSPYGKLLRIDVDRDAADQPYGIPVDNPFAAPGFVDPAGFEARDPRSETPGARQEIWALGLRNPWQFAFDPATGDLYVPDVGQGEWEEINFQPAGAGGGANYGWNWLEGSHCFPADRPVCPRQQVGTLPVAEYAHAEGGCAATGIGVSRSADAPSLDGVYFNADWCSGKIWGLARDDGGVWLYEELLDTELNLTGSGADAAGNLYVTSCVCTFDRRRDPFANPQGALWRLVAADRVPAGAETAPLAPGGVGSEPNPEPESRGPDPAAARCIRPSRWSPSAKWWEAAECCPVEPLDLAVLPRAVRFDELLRRVVRRDRGVEGVAVAVGEDVVGHDPAEGTAVDLRFAVGEEHHRRPGPGGEPLPNVVR